MDLYLQIFFSTVAVAFGMLHIILFVYNKQLKANLFFSIFLFLYGLSTFFDYQASMATTVSNRDIYLQIHRLIFPYPPIFAILFTYILFQLKIPKHFWFIVGGLILFSIPAIIEPVQYFGYAQIFMIGIFIEMVRISILVLKAKLEGATIVIVAFSLLLFFSMYDVLIDFQLISPILNINNGYPFGFLMLVLLMSIYLARDFASVNKKIIEKEREAKELELSQRLLEAEDKRKAKELNDAKELQLSLLPHCITNINNYDFCFDMKPASEVGGDYYDYSIAENGDLTIVIGDATDHGLKAGMMVSIVKSLFLTLGEKVGITEFLNKSSRTIKQMKLKNLYMALMLIKISGNKLTFSSAGIPPLLVFRKKTNEIEEYKIKGMPLGALDSFPYQTLSLELFEGDVVLLMSDGLPELFNSEKASFGYNKLKQIFLTNADLPVTKIVSNLFLAGEEWRGNFEQSDDITLVAFRLNEDLTT